MVSDFMSQQQNLHKMPSDSDITQLTQPTSCYCFLMKQRLVSANQYQQLKNIDLGLNVRQPRYQAKLAKQFVLKSSNVNVSISCRSSEVRKPTCRRLQGTEGLQVGHSCHNYAQLLGSLVQSWLPQTKLQFSQFSQCWLPNVSSLGYLTLGNIKPPSRP